MFINDIFEAIFTLIINTYFLDVKFIIVYYWGSRLYSFYKFFEGKFRKNKITGAGDGDRTHDLDLGKVALYH